MGLLGCWRQADAFLSCCPVNETETETQKRTSVVSPTKFLHASVSHIWASLYKIQFLSVKFNAEVSSQHIIEASFLYLNNHHLTLVLPFFKCCTYPLIALAALHTADIGNRSLHAF